MQILPGMKPLHALRSRRTGTDDLGEDSRPHLPHIYLGSMITCRSQDKTHLESQRTRPWSSIDLFRRTHKSFCVHERSLSSELHTPVDDHQVHHNATAHSRDVTILTSSSCSSLRSHRARALEIQSNEPRLCPIARRRGRAIWRSRSFCRCMQSCGR